MPEIVGNPGLPPSAHPESYARAIALVGFMGAGKTTVGEVLAERLGWRFADLDQLIDEPDQCGGPVAEPVGFSAPVSIRGERRMMPIRGQRQGQGGRDGIDEVPAANAGEIDDFRAARLLLAGIDPSLCLDELEFGKDGKPFSFHAAETQIYRKSRGKWCLVHVQYSTFPAPQSGERK